MDMRYEAYSYADPVFYDSPVQWAARDEFPAATEAAPAGWVRSLREVWVGYRPVEPPLPEQGWKVHVSACLDNAPWILDVVRAHCFEHGVAFKFLRSPALVQTQNAKYASRGSSGKFMTLYPADEAQLERCLTDLDEALAGAPGPYVLSDLRWRSGPLYLRYGAFTEQWCRNAEGELVLALREPSGVLRPDVRRAAFELPEWAPVPAVLAEAVAGAGRSSVGEFPYTVERALHFSNGGGIYLARPVGGGERVVLKEGRPYAGLDQRGEDAVQRLARERRTLEALAGLDAVPAVLGEFTAWEHRFLVQEYVEGEGLHHWFGRRFPLVHPDADEAAVAAYRTEATAVLDAVERALRAIHGRGIVFGDLHPRNLIVREDGSVVFVDFELASPVEEFVRPALGAAGFAAPAGLTGFAVDEHALRALRLWAFLPLLPLTVLHPAKGAALARSARKRFELPDGYLPEHDATEPDRAPQHAHEQAQLAAVEGLFGDGPGGWPALRNGLVAAVAASATPDRADRLFPGDPAQFTHDGLGLSYGAAGVLWALHAVGAEVDPRHVRWLLDAVERQPVRPGLFVGAHGTAWVLDRLGHREPALELLRRLDKDDAQGAGPDLSAGLAGVGLARLHFARATGDRGLLAAAADSADRAVAALRLGGPAPSLARPGLLHGASGTALLLLRLFEECADPGLLDLARAALDRDLDRCVVAEDGTLQVDDGSRVLPYLESGSAGIAAVGHVLLRHRPDPELAERLALVRAAAEPEFIVQPGLFNGRAGLIALLALDAGPDDDLIDRHVRRLAWHVLPYRGRPAFPGEQLLRLSMDLATGTAGVLTALASVYDRTPPMPFWPADS
ncbi:class III lanthionine synthetase LanKC [Kitasatospora sp. NPDC059646]|uniref:class III lanthionine synthetase LanKC n=1 Tax=Kitasatospora sp. NPDC059646 TaxID=3346893 RepID=UPI003693C07E